MIPRYGTKLAEFHRTAELMVEIAQEKGIYYALSLIIDIGYSVEEMKEIRDILFHKTGSRKVF